MKDTHDLTLMDSLVLIVIAISIYCIVDWCAKNQERKWEQQNVGSVEIQD